MSNCVCDCLCFFFDKTWWKDYGIPLLGAVAIPLLVWFLTWYYGAEKAEARKEKRDLRDNLNFLVSVSLASINGLKFLHEKLHEVETKERTALDAIANKLANADSINSDDICFGFLYDNVFKAVEEAKYASCISYNKDIVVDIVRVKSLLSSTEQYVNHRNGVVKSLSECENMNIKGQRIFSFILGDHDKIEEFIADVCRITILLRLLIGNIVKINQEIKGLNLEPQLFTDAQMEFMRIAEDEYADYTNRKKAKIKNIIEK